MLLGIPEHNCYFEGLVSGLQQLGSIRTHCGRFQEESRAEESHAAGDESRAAGEESRAAWTGGHRLKKKKHLNFANL